MKDFLLMMLVLAAGMFGVRMGWHWERYSDTPSRIGHAFIGFIIATSIAGFVAGKFMEPVTGGYDYPFGEGPDRCDVDQFCR